MSARRTAAELVAAWALAAMAAWGLLGARAAAHPGPAAPPEFVIGECVTVVDTRDTSTLALAYNIPFEDEVFDVGEIQLPDSKSHQFFAFAGALVKVGASNAYQLFPFDAAVDQPLAMPLWLDQNDIERAAAAAGPVDMTGFTSAQVLADDVLAARPELSAYLLPFGDKGARVPITEEQARMGASWDLRAVPPGVYTVGGYVFSPPYNDWAVRAGVIKVVDGQTAVPAVAIEPLDAFVYAGQGRRITGCVDAPAGSTLRAWVRPEDQPGAAWEPWLEPQPLAELGPPGRFELCWLNPAEGRANLLRVRVEVTAPDGQRSAAYSSDTLLAVATAAACAANDKTCCPAKQPATDEPGANGDAGVSAGAGGAAGQAGQGGSAAGAGAGGDPGLDPRPSAGAAAGPPARGDDGEPEPPAGTAVGGSSDGEGGGGGCSLRAAPALSPAWFALVWLGLLRARGRSRVRRVETPTDRGSSSPPGTRSGRRCSR